MSFEHLEQVMLNGSAIPEGYVLNKWFHDRTVKKNKNIILVVVGATGSGKSYWCMRACELWYKEYFKEEFPQQNICFSLNEAAKLVKTGSQRRGEAYIVEEAGVLINALAYQNKIQRLFVAILQSARVKNNIFIFNLPMLSMLNKSARCLAHGIFQTCEIDLNRQVTVVKPFYAQTNAISGKTYPKYMRQRIGNHFVTIKRICYHKPSSSISEPYEKRKMEFVNGVLSTFIAENEPKEEEKSKENLLWKAIKELWERGVQNQNEIAKILQISQQTVSKNMQLMAKTDYFKPDYLKKLEIHFKQQTEQPLNLNLQK